MRLFVKLYDKVLFWARHPKAPRYLGLVSFMDSSVFPISPLFMLIPMTYAQPERAFKYANITIITSVLGGILGYFLGVFALQFFILQFIEFMGYTSWYETALQWCAHWGYWAVIFACFAPFIPYKIFTIGAGVLQMNLGWFILASSLGRSLRFYVIAMVIYWGGPKMESFLKRNFSKSPTST